MKFLMQVGVQTMDPMTFIDMFESKSPYNQMSYSNPKYDEMVGKAGNELMSDAKNAGKR